MLMAVQSPHPPNSSTWETGSTLNLQPYVKNITEQVFFQFQILSRLWSSILDHMASTYTATSQC